MRRSLFRFFQVLIIVALLAMVALSQVGLVPVLAQGLMAEEPVESNPILTQADALYAEGKGEQAQSVYEAYLKRNPRSLHARLQVARIAVRYYDFATARQQLETAVVQHPNSAVAAAALGRLFHQWSVTPSENQQDYQDRAREHLVQAYRLNPDDPDVLIRYGLWELETGDRDEAKHKLEQALKARPTHIPILHSLIGHALKENNLGRAKNYTLQAYELDPDNYQTHFYMAQLMALANHPAEAVRYAKRSEAVDFGRLPARDLFLAAQLEKLGRLEEATPLYEKTNKTLPHDARGWVKLAQLYAAQGKTFESTQAFQKAIALDKDVKLTMVATANDHLRAGRLQQALTQWRQLWTIDPNDKTASAIVSSLHYALYKRETPTAPDLLASDIALLNQQIATGVPAQGALLNQAKLMMAQQGAVTPLGPEAMTTVLNGVMNGPDDLAAGEAAFLLRDLDTASKRLSLVEGLSANEYAAAGDRLFLDGELDFSRVFYQRALELLAYEVETDAQYHQMQVTTDQVKQVLNKIHVRQERSKQAISEGDLLFKEKQYKAARDKYEAALNLNSQLDRVYLRLADTYKRTKQKEKSYWALKNAVSLSPALMDSKGFAKKYRKLEKKYGQPDLKN